MIGVSHVSIVEKENVSDIEHLVIGALEELGKVLCRFKNIGKPDQCREILLTTLNEMSSKLHLVSVLLISSLCNYYKKTLYLKMKKFY